MAGKRICAWCKCVIGEIPELTDGDTHGICQRCQLLILCKHQPITYYPKCKNGCVVTGQPAPERCRHGYLQQGLA